MKHIHRRDLLRGGGVAALAGAMSSMALAASNAAGDIVCGRCRIIIIGRSLTSSQQDFGTVLYNNTLGVSGTLFHKARSSWGLSPPSRRKRHENSHLDICCGFSTGVHRASLCRSDRRKDRGGLREGGWHMERYD